MTNVTMKAVDTLHISSVQADIIRPGEKFEINSADADDLERRGLATRVGAKAESAPANKMDAAPANKSAKRKGK